MSQILHPQWPTYEPGLKGWEYNGPIYDLIQALDVGRHYLATTPLTEWVQGRLTVEQIEAIEWFSISSHGEQWIPGRNDDVGTELEFHVLARTYLQGFYAYISAWNDYTGWGCQDGSDVFLGHKDQVIAKMEPTVRAIYHAETETDGQH